MIGDKIRKARESKGMSQEQLGFHIGLSQSAVNKLENGRLRANPKRIVKISEVLELDPANLLQGEDGYFVTIIQHSQGQSQHAQSPYNTQELTQALIRSKDQEIASLRGVMEDYRQLLMLLAEKLKTP
ncbi:MAG: helix-turn-helix domain-containing protein [Bacteroidetes bacterium]|jgi:transcriptional regulator with XRE-family HTH domain|nr:helix-turn-helix domain-containing protein [Bacteroidota bacterium]